MVALAWLSVIGAWHFYALYGALSIMRDRREVAAALRREGSPLHEFLAALLAPVGTS